MSPAAGMLAAGGLLFGLSLLAERILPDPKPEIVIDDHRYAMSLEDFAGVAGRLPSAAEREQILDALIDDAVLYTYAVEVGIYETPAARRRLAQIAAFVSSNPHEGETESEAALAARAIELGLDEDDLVTRRIMVDGARRLIRSVALLREPRIEYLQEYYRTHADEFVTPPRVRITQVLVNAFKWGDDARARAQQVLASIRRESLETDAAIAMGDSAFVPAQLPLLDRHALAARLGTAFADLLMNQPVGTWEGPIPSRYGYHVVRVEEREEPRQQSFDEVAELVRQRALEKIADDWLSWRLAELRNEYAIRLPEQAS